MLTIEAAGRTALAASMLAQKRGVARVCFGAGLTFIAR